MKLRKTLSILGLMLAFAIMLPGLRADDGTHQHRKSTAGSLATGRLKSIFEHANA